MYSIEAARSATALKTPDGNHLYHLRPPDITITQETTNAIVSSEWAFIMLQLLLPRFDPFIIQHIPDYFAH